MRAGSYRPDAARVFTIYEPKPRIITAASFRDRVAQHALCAVISPIFERTLLPRTYACRAGLGTHAGVVAVQADLRRLGMPLYALKTDFSKYFASIDRVVLCGLIRRKISCAATLRLIEAITPPVGVGVPIGALTSQLWANVYGGVVDRHLQMQLGARHWHRYMDDIVVLGARRWVAASNKGLNRGGCGRNVASAVLPLECAASIARRELLGIPDLADP